MRIQLKETLRRLCVEIGWSYSVFWTAIIRHNQMHLVWGDGHCERSTTGQSISGFEAMDLLLKERAGHRTSRDGLFGELGFQATDRVGSLVYKLMASEIHVVGDGIVGEAALTGKHQWIIRDAVSNDGSVPKALTLMNHQFLAGIQTIAIIPVLPHGVLQLGSTEMVMENIEFINNVRSLFNELVSVPGALVSEVTQKPLSQNILQNSSLEVSTSLNQPGVPDTYISRFLSTSVDKSHSQLLQAPDSRSISQASCSSFSHLYGNMPPNPSNMSSTTSTMMPLTDFSQPTVHPVLEPIHSIGKPRTLPIEGQLRNNDNLFQTYDPESIQLEKHQSHRGLLHGAPQDGWQRSSSRVQESKRIVSAASLENHASAPSSQSIRGQVLNKKISRSPEQSTSGNDLFDLLDVHNKSWDFHGNLHDVFVQGNNANSHELCSDFSTCLTELDMGTVFDTLNEQISCHGLFSEASPDQLLDAVVSCKTSLTNISSSSHHTSSATCGWAASSEQTHGECLGLPPLVKSEAAGSSSVVSSCGVERNAGCSQKDGGHKSQISLWVENSQNLDGGNSAPAPHGKGIDEVAKLNRKRSRSGENPRPRPKDRQMIQDRVKELRDIVPNGAKCSIDALLEKTIKHMLFLQSVTKHADKLKEVGEPKIVSEEGGLLLKDNFEGGATWAFEIGTQSMICPIIVEDLNLPRQMLVEMLCEERGLFLEIADLIRGLGLTILKGVLEARNDKVWARFAVEANRDVTRMEIFLSLVRLLEPNGGNSMVPLQGIESLNMPHNMFHSLPARAAGLSNCLLR